MDMMKNNFMPFIKTIDYRTNSTSKRISSEELKNYVEVSMVLDMWNDTYGD